MRRSRKYAPLRSTSTNYNNFPRLRYVSFRSLDLSSKNISHTHTRFTRMHISSYCCTDVKANDFSAAICELVSQPSPRTYPTRVCVCVEFSCSCSHPFNSLLRLLLLLANWFANWTEVALLRFLSARWIQNVQGVRFKPIWNCTPVLRREVKGVYGSKGNELIFNCIPST